MPLLDGLGPASALPGGRSRSGEAADAMRAYYRERAPEYDLLYAVPAYQDDLATLRGWLEPHVVGASVLEVAAGTGYWTEAAAPFARAITATDCNAETLAVAARRRLGPKVTLVEADAYALPDFGAGFEVGMAHLWWSHVKKERRPAFLSGLAARLRPNATLLMLDQRFRRGWGPPCCRRDRFGNRYEMRRAGGAEYEVVKNYPGPKQLRDGLAGICESIEILLLDRFWAVRARIAGTRL
jgi:SAM-dependent methyltransferase